VPCVLGAAGRRRLVAGLNARDRPNETTELAGHGDLGLVALQSPGQQAGEAQVQPVLGLPAQRPDLLGLAFLASKFAAYNGDFGVVAWLCQGGMCSDDRFSDFRSWLISRGRASYEAALAYADAIHASRAPGR